MIEQKGLFEIPKSTSVFYTIPDFAWISFFIFLFLISYFIIVGNLVKNLKEDEVPSKFISYNLMLVEKINSFLKETIGIRWTITAPNVYALFSFILISNFVGIVGIQMPSLFTAITIALSTFAIFTIQYTAIRSQKLSHFGNYYKPFTFMFPFNVFGDITPIVSMAFRLFGNILSGTLMLFMVYTLLNVGAPFITPVLHIIFDIGFGFIQAFVFLLLTSVFASMKVKASDKYLDTDENFLLEYRLLYQKENINKKVK